MDKRRKKELRQQYKDQEQAEARRRMCLQPDQLRALLNYLDEQLFQVGAPCDHTLSRTHTWAVNEGFDPERVLESVRSFGGYCDCEVAYNVRPYLFGWEE
ncbi:MAG TPA: DUF2695 domain-containing protein [Gemmataceae bacterium]|jgi:hypothetical protein